MPLITESAATKPLANRTACRRRPMSSSRPKGRAASQRPTSRSKRAQKPRHQPPSLVHLLEFDAGGLNFASELCGFVGVDVLDRLEAVSGGAKRAVGLSPISLALTAKEEAAPLAAVLAAHPLRSSGISTPR